MIVGSGLVLLTLLAQEPVDVIQRRAQLEIDGLVCPCAEAGVSYSKDDLLTCRQRLVDLKVLEVVSAQLLPGQTTSPSLSEVTAQFAWCVKTSRGTRDRDAELKRMAIENQRRQAVREAEARKLASLVERSRIDPEIIQVVSSGNLCDASTKKRDAAAERQSTLSEIAEEKRYAKKVGVTNLRKLQDLKEDLQDQDERIRNQDERIAQITAGLRRVHRPALRCSDPSLASLQSCYNTQGDDSVPNECAEDAMRVKVALFSED